MRPCDRSSVAVLATCLVCSAVAAGRITWNGDTCPKTEARRALEASLTAWKEGRSADSLAIHSPPIRFVDFESDSGKNLESFEVLTELPGVVEQRFSVMLRFKATSSLRLADYVVVCYGPTWVCRKENYAGVMKLGSHPLTTAAR